MTKVTPHEQTQDFFACGSSAPVRLEPEGGAAAWVTGTLVVSGIRGDGLRHPQELWPHQSLFFFFEPLLTSDQKDFLASVSP